MSDSQHLHERALRAIPGGVNSGQRAVAGIEDLVVAKASGATFQDTQGHEYIDFHAAVGPLILGHCDPDVNAAVAEAMSRVDLIGVGVTDLEVQLAEEIIAAFDSIEQVLAS